MRSFCRLLCSAKRQAPRWSAIVLVPFLLTTLEGQAEEASKTAVADLRYGVALYHYYQQDYLNALAELMVADTRNGIQGHSDNPELIAGGISLAFGMEQQAESVFSRVLADERRPLSARDAAWFYLGKLYYTRGDWAAAERSFERVSAAFKPSLRAQLEALQTNLLIHTQRHTSLTPDSLNPRELQHWTPYALFNLGAAHARAGEQAQAQAFFNAVTALEVPKASSARDEFWAMQDKAYTALGYSYLIEKKYAAAIRAFTQVRLHGLEANQALLGYGWAAVAQEQYTKALQPWQLLRSRSLISAPVQEAFLAVPFAYEKLGALGEAVTAYSQAEEVLNREIQWVGKLRDTLTDGELLTLISAEPLPADEAQRALQAPAADDEAQIKAVLTDEGHNWLSLDRTSVIKTRSGYLRELFAQTAFQTAVLELRDLLRLQQVLQAWGPKLTLYRELLLQKQSQRVRQEADFARAGASNTLATLQAQRDQLAASLARISAEEDYLALADERTQALQRRVAHAGETLQRMQAAGQGDEAAAARQRLFAGIVLWRAAQDYPATLAGRQQELAQIDEILARLRNTQTRVQELTATSLDIQPLLGRLRALDQETQTQLQVTERAIAHQAQALRQQVEQQLLHQESRLKHYLAQAHLAVARLYDAELRRSAE